MKQAIVRIATVALIAAGTLVSNRPQAVTTVNPHIPIPICPSCGRGGAPVPPSILQHVHTGVV